MGRGFEPRVVRETDFKPVDSPLRRHAGEPFSYFEFAPAEKLDLDLVSRTIEAACDEVESVDVVCLPESAAPFPRSHAECTQIPAPMTPISLAAQRATKTVPIVCMSGNPVGAGLVASLSHPGGNITGMSLLSGEYSAKWLELISQVAPKVHRIAVLWNADNPALLAERDQLQRAARVIGLELKFLSVRAVEVESSLAALVPVAADAFVVVDDALLEPLVPRLIALAAERYLPALYAFSTAVQQGGLMSYSANFFEMWRHLARYIDRILKGERPADLPIEQATAVTLAINLNTAKALGLTIPPTLLATADEVIE
jgi:putative ABC transport system substrate-binding protein